MPIPTLTPINLNPMLNRHPLDHTPLPQLLPLLLPHLIHLPQTPLPNRLVEELIQIQPQHLLLVLHPQSHPRDVLQNQQQRERDRETVPRDRADLGELLRDLDAVAVDGAGGLGAEAVEGRDGATREDAGEEGAAHAADAVQLEDLEAVVDAQELVDVLAEIDEDGGQEANERRAPDGDVAGGRGDADEAGDGALAGADHGELTVVFDVVDQDPADDAGAGGEVGVVGGEHGAHGGVEGGAAVEAEPAEPDEDGAEEDDGHVVRFVEVQGLFVRGFGGGGGGFGVVLW